MRIPGNQSHYFLVFRDGSSSCDFPGSQEELKTQFFHMASGLGLQFSSEKIWF